MEFKNAAQKLAWANFQQHDILFLIGPAGTGKSFLAMAFAINEILARRKDKIILTRPIVEAGESLGYLPGPFDEKVAPYMTPLFDCMTKLVGPNSSGLREIINNCIEVAPLAYMRGRAQPLDAKIVTPTGIALMGDIKVGDYVIGSNGKPTKVLGVYPQGFKDVYTVTMSDGVQIECCGEHLWSTQTLSEKRHDKGFSAKDTLSIKKSLKTNFNQKNHKIPMLSAPVEFESREVSLNPYLLGLLIGDGSLHESASICICTADEEIAESVNEIVAPQGLKIKYRQKYDYAIINEVKGGKNVLKSILREMDLLGKKSYNKFIPKEYLFNDVSTRVELLRGLMDTDGTVVVQRSKKSRLQYCTTSEQLAEDFVFLVQSLGGIAYKRERIYSESDSHEYKGKTIRHARNSFIIDFNLDGSFNPFRLSRKRDKYVASPNLTRLIASVEYKSRRMCQCIRVEADDHLYLTNGCVLTHNTFDNSVCIFDESQNASLTQLKLFMTRLGENSKMIINGDPYQSDIPGPVALNDVVERLETVEGVGAVHFKSDSIVRNPLIAKILEKI